MKPCAVVQDIFLPFKVFPRTLVARPCTADHGGHECGENNTLLRKCQWIVGASPPQHMHCCIYMLHIKGNVSYTKKYVNCT